MDEELDLLDLFFAFWKRKVWIIAAVIVGVICGFIYTRYIVVPKYTSSVTLILSKPTSVVSDSQKLEYEGITQSDITLNQKLISTYGEIMKSRRVCNEVIKNLDLDITYSEIIKCINVSSVKDTDVIKLSITVPDPKLAADIANDMIKVFTAEVIRVYNIQNVSIIDPAEENPIPVNISYLKNEILFAMVCLLVVCAVIFLIYYFDNTIKTEDDIHKIVDVPLLATIPSVETDEKKAKGGKKDE